MVGNCFPCGKAVEDYDYSGDIIRRFSIEELNEYTDNFSGKNLKGKGGFGPVFQGFIRGRRNAQHIAVKCSRNRTETVITQWQAEVEYLPKVEHENIIRLIGYCETSEKLYLVYPFMQNGSVLHQLQGLDWDQTLKIIKGVASALQKLHDHKPPLIHRDLKLDNILLDKDSTPILADFGRVTPEGQYSGSREDDIFGFGETILQLLMKDKTKYHIGNNRRISDRAANYSSNPMELVDLKLRRTGCSKQAAKAIAQLGLDCVKPNPFDRPNISQLIHTLAN